MTVIARRPIGNQERRIRAWAAGEHVPDAKLLTVKPVNPQPSDREAFGRWAAGTLLAELDYLRSR